MMGVAIREIHVKHCGPIKRLSWSLKNLNVIFGHNEQGKTYLVEFLIHSLFRNARQWRLRANQGVGRVSVEGLSDEILEFSPKSSQKLDDLWGEQGLGLPPDFSRLLVVKGAEVELADISHGATVDLSLIKRYLTGQDLLDTIDNRIPKTIQKADIHDSVVIGSRQGSLKDREELAGKLSKLNDFFKQLDKGYSGAKRKLLYERLLEFEEEFNRLLRAKAYTASKLDKQIQSLEKERQRISENKLQEARESLRVYKQKIEEYKRKKKDQESAEKNSQHHEWLTVACDVYQRMLEPDSKKPSPLLLIAAALLALAAGAFAFLRIPYGTIGALLVMLIVGWLYFRNIYGLAREATEREELHKLDEEFQARFGLPLSGLPLLQEHLHKTAEDYSRARLLKDQLFSDLRSIEAMKLKLSDQIVALTGSVHEPETWESLLTELSEQQRDLSEKIQSLRIRFAQLDVDPSDFINENPNIEFSRQSFENVKAQLSDIRSQLKEEEGKLSTLKQMICHQTGDDITTHWEPLIENLRDRREGTRKAYREKTAEIVGKVLVHRVLETLRKDEDTKLQEGLTDSLVQEPLGEITRRYDRFALEGDQVYVKDEFHEFPISELSTGAQEQVLLAMRIGFASYLLKEMRPFLILDDAFQYSDWQRREWLVDRMVRLADQGWQVIYFTMDDHIRDLFKKKGTILNDNFSMFHLEEEGTTA